MRALLKIGTGPYLCLVMCYFNREVTGRYGRTMQFERIAILLIIGRTSFSHIYLLIQD